MSSIKKYIRISLGVIAFLFGLVCFMLPFLPFGYVFFFIACFFLASYIPQLQRFIDYLKTKDKKGYLVKAECRIQQFENWLNSKIQKHYTKRPFDQKKCVEEKLPQKQTAS